MSARSARSRSHPSRLRSALPRRASAWGGVLLVLLGTALLAGCGRGTLVGRQYDNLTAYYNTFYNANKAFEKGVEAVQPDRDAPVSLSRYVPVFESPTRSGSNADFEEAIDKSASILRDHPGSKWADDALLLIGTSYFYQGNDVGAEQKFREVISLGAGKEGEARFWLARTLVAANRPDAAGQALRNSLDAENDFGEWTDRMYLMRGQLRVQRGQWDDAEADLQRGLQRGGVPGTVEARAALLLGQVRETLGRMDAAAAAYNTAAQGPTYELEYAGKVSAIRVRGMHQDADAALEDLRSLIRDDKNVDKQGELLLLRGRLLWAAGRPADARSTLRGVLGDEDISPRGPVRGRIHYALGRLYRDAWNDFQRAAAHFDTAATDLQSLAASEEEDNALPPSPTAVTDSRDQSTRYGVLAKRSARVARLDSLLRLGRMPQETFDAFIADLEAKQAAEREAQRRAQAREANAQRFASATATSRRSTTTTAATASGNEASSFLFHENPVRVQEGRQSFERVWGDRPRAENWRRIAALSGGRSQAASRALATDTTAAGRGAANADEATAEASGEASVGAGTDGANGTAGGPSIDISDVPRTPAAQDEMVAKRAVARYELGNALFLSAQRPDSAATWYRRVVENDADHPVAQRALYALAEAEAALNHNDEAERLYRQVIEDNPESVFAQRARRQVGESTKQIVDARAEADSAYATAYRLWQTHQWAASLVHLQRVVRVHPDTPAAPRALLAAVMVGAQWQQQAAAPDTVAHHLRQFAEGLPDGPALSAVRDAPTAASSAEEPADGTPAEDPASETTATDNRASQATEAPVRRSAPTRRSAIPSRSADTTATPMRPPTRASGSPVPPTPGAVDSSRMQGEDTRLRPNEQRPAPASAAPDSAAVDTAAVDIPTTDRGNGAEARAGSTASPDTTTVPEEAPQMGARSILLALLQHIPERYPDAPQSQRATQMHEAWTAPPPDSAPESEAAGAGEGDAGGSASRAQDGSASPQEAASEAASTKQSRPQRAGPQRVPRPQQEARQPAAGQRRPQRDAQQRDTQKRAPRRIGPAGAPSAWALRVDTTYATPAAADSQAAAFRDQLRRRLPVRTQTADSTSTPDVFIGAFDSEPAAERARRRLQRMLNVPLRAQPVPSDR